jgi:hypothetical protein
VVSTITGSFAIDATAIMFSFPCQGSCGGYVGGEAAGVVSGLGENGVPYVAAWSLGTFSAGLDFQDLCPLTVPLPGLVAETGAGTATISGGSFLLGGNGDPATITIPFLWVRNGTGVVLVVDAASVSGAGGRVALGASDPGGSTATYIPYPDSNLVPPTCSAPRKQVARFDAASLQIGAGQ